MYRPERMEGNQSISQYRERLYDDVTYSSQPRRLLRLEISDICNQDCIFCCWKGVKKQHAEKPFTVDDYEFLVDAALQSDTYDRFMLTGGEPLLVNDQYLGKVIESIESQRNRGMKEFWICTNGVLLSDKAALLAKSGLKKLDVSLAACDEEKYKSYTRSEFGINNILKGIERATSKGIGVRISVPVYRGGINSLDDLHKLIALVRDAGATDLGFFKLHKTSNNASVFNKLFFNVDSIIYDIQRSPIWAMNIDECGQCKMVDRFGFKVTIPCNEWSKNEACAARNCGYYCQGTYAAYVSNRQLRFCHREFSDGLNERNIEESIKSRDRDSLIEIMREAAHFSN